MPKAMGGTGEGQNPEQLFAMGYSGMHAIVLASCLELTTSAIACLLGAIQLRARQMGKPEAAAKAVVHASVSLGETQEEPGLGLAVDIKVENVEEDVLQAGHEVRSFGPYAHSKNDCSILSI
jgi:organic hydroperoxide reductase OsmC/OhrA